MALWTFTKVSQDLGCSVQNISNRKGKLKSMGFIEKDVDGKEKINENGYNYLMEQRKNSFKSDINKFSNNLVNNDENLNNINENETKQLHSNNDFIIEFLQKEIEDLKIRLNEETQQKIHWQELYIKQNEDFKKLAFPPMLDTQEGNRNTEEREKRGFWSRLFRTIILNP